VAEQQKTAEQLTAVRGLYQDLGLQRDDLQREVDRLRSENNELRSRYVEAEARRRELEREVDQLITADRAARRLVVRAEVDEATGADSGYVHWTRLRSVLGLAIEED
jgi:hypothetical protein